MLFLFRFLMLYITGSSVEVLVLLLPMLLLLDLKCVNILKCSVYIPCTRMLLVSEKDLIVREEACRIGLLFGGFTGSYHALRCLLRKLRKIETPFNVILAGSIAGLSVLALDDSNRRRTLALYLLARVAQFMDSPARTCWLALKGAVRSTTFLSAFVGIFQGVKCVHRKVASKDHKLVYWTAGAIAALSVLLEKKARRGELALYVLPRAGDSLWYIIVNRHLLPNVKIAERPYSIRMDRRLFEAALTGDVENLHQLLGENPLLLHTVSLASSQNPLHVASVYGHIDFVKEIIRLKPDFAKEVNQDGFSPMHMASANGHIQIVRELLKVDPKLCHLQGREKMTPLHYAAIRGRVDVISEMVSACGESVEDVTVQRETALYLAVKNNQFEAIRVFVDWIKKMKKEYILNMKDEQGSTILHLATWNKQRQVIELLLEREEIGSRLTLEVNAINQSGLTALDVLLIFPSEAGDREIEEILSSAGAMRNINILHSSSSSTSQPHNQTTLVTNSSRTTWSCLLLGPEHDLMEYFKFKNGRDSPGEARTALLVIAVLVATATFQFGINPPGGVWQDNNSNNNGAKGNYVAGTSIMGSLNATGFAVFMLFNSIGFALSLRMINILTINFPLLLELQICIMSMYCTYNTAVINTAPDGLRQYIIVITAILPVIIPLIAIWVRRYIKRLMKLAVNMIRRVI